MAWFLIQYKYTYNGVARSVGGKDSSTQSETIM